MPVQGSKGIVIYKDDDTEVKVIGDHVRFTLKAPFVDDAFMIPTETFKKIYRKWNHFQRESK